MLGVRNVCPGRGREVFNVVTMGLQPFYGIGPHPLLWAGLWSTCGRVTVSGVHNCIIVTFFCIYIIYKCGFRPQFGDPWY
jgi:hypothetical protein